MQTIVEEVVSPADLEKFRKKYEKCLNAGQEDNDAQFDYAWCLVRSCSKEDNKLGLTLLENLYHKSKDDLAKRDYLFYLAVGNTRLKDYPKALKFSRAILHVQPKNHQALELIEYIEKKQTKDGLIGMAIIGSTAAIVVGGLVGLGVALTKK